MISYIHLPLTLLFHISYIQLELLVTLKLSLTIYFPTLSLLKKYLVKKLKKVNKYKLKFKTKPWITPALQKSIFNKNNLLKKIITAKDPQVKERYHQEYKDYRNMLYTILKQSKTNYYNHYFETNWNSIKNTWKGIKSILNIESISADNIKSLTVDGITISNPISNIFNNYFS